MMMMRWESTIKITVKKLTMHLDYLAFNCVIQSFIVLIQIKRLFNAKTGLLLFNWCAREVWTNHHSWVGVCSEKVTHGSYFAWVALKQLTLNSSSMEWRPNYKSDPSFEVITDWQHRRYASTFLPALLFTLWFWKMLQRISNSFAPQANRRLFRFGYKKRSSSTCSRVKAIEPLLTSSMDAPWDLAPLKWCNRN